MKVFLADIMRLQYFNNAIHKMSIRKLGVLIGDSLEEVLEKYDLKFIDTDSNPLAEPLYVPVDSQINTAEKFGAMILDSNKFFFAIQLRELTLTDAKDLDSYLAQEYGLLASQV